jgi:hypothetical protein
MDVPVPQKAPCNAQSASNKDLPIKIKSKILQFSFAAVPALLDLKMHKDLKLKI